MVFGEEERSLAANEVPRIISYHEQLSFYITPDSKERTLQIST